MHIIVLLICVPILVIAFFSLTVWLPFMMVVEGLTNKMPGFALIGVALFIAIWTGIFSLIHH